MYKLFIIVARDKYSNDGGAAVATQLIEFDRLRDADLAYDLLAATEVPGRASMSITKLY